MENLYNYLMSVKANFEDYLSSGKALCDLSSMRFNSGNLPDYTNKHIQELYILRYTYAYAFDYKYLYKMALSDVKKKHIKVLSIGCGNYVDYFGLRAAVSRSASIDYHGVDVVDWYYKFNADSGDRITFSKGDVLEYLLKQDQLDYDLYIFPKSISEFSKRELQQIGKAIAEMVPSEKNIKILLSLRAKEQSMNSDKANSTVLHDALCECGMLADSNNRKTYKLKSNINQLRINKIDESFDNPTEIDCLLKHLSDYCNENQSFAKCNSCPVSTNWRPKLNCTEFYSQIFNLQKDTSY